jgi:hypothetical protein
MKEAVAEPANKKQRALRAHIRRVRAEAEQTALRQIQLAGSTEWRAAAWFLTSSIRGKYLRSAKATRPEVNISVSDIARTLAEEGVLPDGHHQNGHHQNGAIVSDPEILTGITAHRIFGSNGDDRGIASQVFGDHYGDDGIVSLNGESEGFESTNGDHDGPV